MGIKVKFSHKFLNDLVQDSNSGIELEVNRTKYVNVSPFELQNLSVFIKEYLDSLVATFDPELSGIILSHQKIKVNPQFNVQADGTNKLLYIADIYVFRPKIGSVLTGVVNQKSEDHVGCLLHRVFNVTIPKPGGGDGGEEEEEEEVGVWRGVSVGQEVRFKVVAFDITLKIPSIHGKILDSSTPHSSNDLELNYLSQKNSDICRNDSIAGDDSDNEIDSLGGVKTQRPLKIDEKSRMNDSNDSNDSNLIEDKVSNEVVDRTSLSTRKSVGSLRVDRRSSELLRLKDVENDSDSFIPPSPVKPLNKSVFEKSKGSGCEVGKNNFDVSTTNITFRNRKNNLWVNDEPFGNVSGFLKNLDSPQSCLRRSVSPSSSNNSPTDKRNRSVRFSTHNSVMTFASNADCVSNSSEDDIQETSVKFLPDSNGNPEGIETEAVESFAKSATDVDFRRESEIVEFSKHMETVVGSKKKSEIVESSKNSETVVGSKRKSEIVESSKNSETVVDSKKKSEIVESSKNSETVVDSKKKSEIVESSKNSAKVGDSKIVESSTKSSTILDSNKNSEVVESSSTKSPTIHESSKRSDDNIGEIGKKVSVSRKSPVKRIECLEKSRNIDDSSESDDSFDGNDGVSSTQVNKSSVKTGVSPVSQKSSDKDLKRKDERDSDGDKRRSSEKALRQSDETSSNSSDFDGKFDKKSTQNSNKKCEDTFKTSPKTQRSNLSSVFISKLDDSFESRRKEFLEDTKSPEKQVKVSVKFEKKSNKEDSDKFREKLNFDENVERRSQLNFQKSGDVSEKRRREKSEKEIVSDDSGISEKIKMKSKENNCKIGSDSEIESKTDGDSENEVAQLGSKIRIEKSDTSSSLKRKDDTSKSPSTFLKKNDGTISPNTSSSSMKNNYGNMKSSSISLSAGKEKQSTNDNTKFPSNFTSSLKEIQSNDVTKSLSSSLNSMKPQQFTFVFNLTEETPRRPRRDSEKHDSNDEIKHVSGIESRVQNIEKVSLIKVNSKSPGNEILERNRIPKDRFEETDFQRKLSGGVSEKNIITKEKVIDGKSENCEKSKDSSPEKSIRERTSSICEESTVTMLLKDAFSKFLGSKNRKSMEKNVDSVDASTVDESTQDTDLELTNKKRKSKQSFVGNVVDKTRENSGQKSKMSCDDDNKVGAKQENNRRKSCVSHDDGDKVGANREKSKRKSSVTYDDDKGGADQEKSKRKSSVGYDGDDKVGADQEKSKRKSSVTYDDDNVGANQEKSKRKSSVGSVMNEFGTNKYENTSDKKCGGMKLKSIEKTFDPNLVEPATSHKDTNLKDCEDKDYDVEKGAKKAKKKKKKEKELNERELGEEKEEGKYEENTKEENYTMADLNQKSETLTKKEKKKKKRKSGDREFDQNEMREIKLPKDNRLSLENSFQEVDLREFSKKEKRKKNKKKELDVERKEESCMEEKSRNHVIVDTPRELSPLNSNLETEMNQQIGKKAKKKKRKHLQEVDAMLDDKHDEVETEMNQLIGKKEKKKKRKNKNEGVGERELGDNVVENTEKVQEKNKKSSVSNEDEMDVDKLLKKEKKRRKKNEEEREVQNVELVMNPNQEIEAEKIARKAKKKKSKEMKVEVEENQEVRSSLQKDPSHESNVEKLLKKEKKMKSKEEFRKSLESYFIKEEDEGTKNEKLEKLNPDLAEKSLIDGYITDYSTSRHKTNKKSSSKINFEGKKQENTSISNRDFKNKHKSDKSSVFQRGENKLIVENEGMRSENCDNSIEKVQKLGKSKKFRNRYSGNEFQNNSSSTNLIEEKEKSRKSNEFGEKEDSFAKKDHQNLFSSPKKFLDGYNTDCKYPKNELKKKSSFNTKRDGYTSDFKVKTQESWTNIDERKKNFKKFNDMSGNTTLDGYITDCRASKHKNKKSSFKLKRDGYASDFETNLRIQDGAEEVVTKKKHKSKTDKSEMSNENEATNIDSSMDRINSLKNNRKRKKSVGDKSGNDDEFFVKAKKMKVMGLSHVLESEDVENRRVSVGNTSVVGGGGSIKKKTRKRYKKKKDSLENIMLKNVENLHLQRSGSVETNKKESINVNSRESNRKRKISDAGCDLIPTKKSKIVELVPSELKISDVKIVTSDSIRTKKYKTNQSKFAEIVDTVESYSFPTNNSKTSKPSSLKLEIGVDKIDENLNLNEGEKLLHGSGVVGDVEEDRKTKNRKSYDTDIGKDKIQSRRSCDTDHEMDKIQSRKSYDKDHERVTQSRRSYDKDHEMDKIQSRKSCDTDFGADKIQSRKSVDTDHEMDKIQSIKSCDTDLGADKIQSKKSYDTDHEIDKLTEKTKPRKSNDRSNEVDEYSEKSKSRKSNDTTIEVNRTRLEDESSEGITNEEVSKNSFVTRDSESKKRSSTSNILFGTVGNNSKTPKKSAEKSSKRKTPRKSTEDPNQLKLIKYFSPVKKCLPTQENSDNLDETNKIVANSSLTNLSGAEKVDLKVKKVLSFPENEKKADELGENIVKKKKKKRKGDDLLKLQQEMIDRLLKNKSS